MEGVSHPRMVAAALPGKLAVVMPETGASLSYAALVENADRAAALFAALGVVAGQTIAIFMENNLRYAELCWAAKNSGLYYVCISNQLNAVDLDYIVRNCEARLLVTSFAMRAEAAELARRLGDEVVLLMVDGAVAPFLPYESLLAEQPAVVPASGLRGASMLYSSGTTGRPKGVRPPLEAVPVEVPPRRQKMLVESFGFAPDMVFLNPGPLYHAAPLRKMMAVLRLGGTVVQYVKFDAQTTLDAIAAYRVTHAFFVPTMFVRMLRLDDAARAAADVSSLRGVVHGAAPCPPAVKHAMIAWWGPVIHEVYGGTEAMGHTVILAPEWLAHPGSVGRPPPGCRIKLVGEDGRPVAQGEDGVVYLKNGNRFAYHNEAEKTASVYDDEGYATFGDIGHLDAEGYLYLTDRKAHMIISGGVNIYPQEAENVLIRHPRIVDVAVIGVPHAEFGEEVKAIVEVTGAVADEAALAADIIAFCRARLSAIKCPRSVDFIASMPRNDMGKLQKRELKRRYWQDRASLIA